MNATLDATVRSNSVRCGPVVVSVKCFDVWCVHLETMLAFVITTVLSYYRDRRQFCVYIIACSSLPFAICIRYRFSLNADSLFSQDRRPLVRHASHHNRVVDTKARICSPAIWFAFPGAIIEIVTEFNVRCQRVIIKDVRNNWLHFSAW